MGFVSKASIQQKLTILVLCTNLFGLSMACLAFEFYEKSSFRGAMTREVSALANTLGTNIAASLAFNDRHSAQEMLKALRAESHIAEACLYDRHGTLFAEYRREGVDAHLRAPEPQGDGAQFGGDYLTLYRSIYIGEEKAGTIAIVTDLGAFQAKMKEYREISIAVLALSVLATFLVSSRLLRLITEPILQLAGLASRVSAQEDYTLRATAGSNDEVGTLIGSFNQMLERIQERDAALKRANDELETRVHERTEELRREIMERVRTQETLSEERKILRGLIDNVPDHMYVKDVNCRFLVANLAVARQMGTTPEEALGKSDFDFYPADLAKTFYEGERRVILSGNAEVNREETGLDSEGKVSQIMTTQAPIRDKFGRVTGLVGISRDITHLKKAQEELRIAKEAAEAGSRAKSEFLANMSHEIRTPLNGVMGMTDLALDTQLTPEQREYLETVKMSSDGLLTVINDILDFSKIEAGRIDLEAVEFNLRDCMEAAMKTLAVRADEKGLELLCEIGAEVPETVRGDASRLRQIAINLLGNAIKFTSEGEVALKVQLEAEEGQERLLHFIVRDTGIGIPQEKLKMIFEPFSQADTSTTRQFGGTGLGLTISTRLVEMMGGKIWVESEVGKGSQFHFTARFGAVGKREAKPASAVPPENLSGVKVLVVDDNRTNRRILEGMLSRWGMEAYCAEDGEEALAELSAALKAGNPYRLILTDRHMPKMDGFAFIESVRQRVVLSAAMIVMLTSAGHRGDAARCQELGVAGYLLKPIRQAELREAIARVLAEKERETESRLVTRYSVQGAGVADASLCVLLAEDNAVNQKLATRLLEKRGHRVKVASNGKEALEALRNEKFDLVLMDVQMPEMDGFEATAAIREKEKGSLERQPVIALTAHAMKGDREKCLAAGMDGYLTKPIRPQELDELLRMYVMRKMEAAKLPEPAPLSKG